MSKRLRFVEDAEDADELRDAFLMVAGMLVATRRAATFNARREAVRGAREFAARIERTDEVADVLALLEQEAAVGGAEDERPSLVNSVREAQAAGDQVEFVATPAGRPFRPADGWCGRFFGRELRLAPPLRFWDTLLAEGMTLNEEPSAVIQRGLRELESAYSAPMPATISAKLGDQQRSWDVGNVYMDGEITRAWTGFDGRVVIKAFPQ